MRFLQSSLGRCVCWCLLTLVVVSFPATALAQPQCQSEQNALNQLMAQLAAIKQKLLKGGLTNAAVNELLGAMKAMAPQISNAQNALKACQSAGAGSTPVTPQPILPDCSVIQKQISDLEKVKATLTSQLSSPNLTPQQKETLEQLLRMDNSQIITQENALKSCRQATGSPTARQRILEIAFQNPAYDEQSTGSWAYQLVLKLDPDDPIGQTFPESKNQGKEWIPVLDPANDYDTAIVGASGWAIDPRSNTVDFPFDHPFQADWEASLALDMNQNGTGPFTFLLSNGDKATADHPDQVADESEAAARGLPTFMGLLGIEMDAGLVPAQFKQATVGGNRLAVFGRWIVDAGHDTYRAEIHPPLMMASASVTPANTTRALFTSRPFLVGSTYTVDESTTYVDSAPDDGYFLPHLAEEMLKASAGSTLVEAHVKVKSRQFDGIHIMHFLVRPPSAPAAIGGFSAKLAVSFHFTVRSGIAVQVFSSTQDTVDVMVTVNSADKRFRAPALPTKKAHIYTPDELKALNGEVSSIEDWINAAAILLPLNVGIADVVLNRGVEGDQYASQENAVDMLTQTNAVQNGDPAHLPANAGITVNDNQPYPVTGWMEVKWSKPVLAPKKPVQPKPVQPAPPPVVKH